MKVKSRFDFTVNQPSGNPASSHVTTWPDSSGNFWTKLSDGTVKRINWAARGAWAALTSYASGDVAYVAGTPYLCVLAVSSITPPASDATHWTRIVDSFANPMSADGDVIIGGSSGIATALAKGANGSFLGVDGSGNLAYSAPLGNQLAAAWANPFVNPAFTVWNEGTSFSLAAGNITYGAEGWICTQATDGTITMSRSTDVPAIAAISGVPQYSLQLEVATADASLSDASTQRMIPIQRMEGWRVAPFLHRDCTLAFWAKCSKIGTYSIVFRNTTTDRTLVQTWTVSVANVWTLYTIPMPAAPVSGTENYQTGSGLTVHWGLASSAAGSTAPGSWTTPNWFGATGQTNFMDTVGNRFNLYGPILVPGSICPPFMARPFDDELRLCQRFWESSYDYGVAPGTVTATGAASGQASNAVAASTAGSLYEPCTDRFVVPKRVTPTVTLYATSGATNAVGVVGSGDRSGATATSPSTRKPADAIALDATSAVAVADRQRVVYHWVANARF